MSREPTKAVRYIQTLDQVRCDGDWDAVPELVRKIRKHAPHRTCLVLVAETEHAVIQASQYSNPTSTDANKPSLAPLIAPLFEAIENEKSFAEDKFQARVCLGWIYWLGGKPDLACSNLPESIEQEFAQLDGTGQDTAAWTKVCALKASYIKGTSLVKTTAAAEALQTFESALPILSSVTSKSLDGSSEQRTWTELLLTQLCLLSSSAIKTKSHSLPESETLSAFRAWGNFWERQRGQPSSSIGGHAVNSDIPRRQVWKEYYFMLSTILQQGLPYPTTSMATAYADASTKLLQWAELQRVESKYEELLLQELQFPTADETNAEVEEWAELVVQNWIVLCGNEWQEYDSNQNGLEATSRRVLDILYRAATKTFHSTSILRHLFTVHLAVGEFDMAFRAFDTYLEIVKKGKARVEKTGETEKGLDNDEIVLMTASQYIRALCRYGYLNAAEKAKDIGHFLEEWLRKHYPQTSAEKSVNGYGDGQIMENGEGSRSKASISAPVLAATWRSIGIGKAQWARYTYDAASRSDIQMQAIESLRKALLPGHDGIDDIHTLFALAVVLSERRQLDAAISVVKKALSAPSSTHTSVELGPRGGRFARERSLMPLWHLLALLLSARQEFAVAIRACEGAFEQFKEPKNLFGDTEINGTYRSEHLNLKAMNEKPSSYSKGIVDYMDDFEKETVLEVKMTQLVLIEILEGPQVAVNASDELLSLYTRLFGEPQKTLPIAPKTSHSVAPLSSAGTLRSIKGSIFGRSRKSIHKSSDTRGRASSLNEKSDLPVRPQTAQTHASTAKAAPTIHVTNENGGTTTQSHEHEKLQKRSASLSRKKSHGSVRNRSASAGPANTEKRTASTTHGEHTVLQRDPSQRLKAARSGQDGLSITSVLPPASLVAQEESPAATSSKPLPLSSQNMLQKEESLKPKPNSQQDTRLPYISSRSLTTNPRTRFPLHQERRRRVGILIKVWLLISGFYRRARMYDDSKGAIDEAYKLAESLELDVSRDMTGNISIYDGGWGVHKCVEELWGDIWSEVSVQTRSAVVDSQLTSLSRGSLSNAKGTPYVALREFESALNHFPDHASAIVGLSNILLDIYTEKLLPPPTNQNIDPTMPLQPLAQSISSMSINHQSSPGPDAANNLNSSATYTSTVGPLGLPASNNTSIQSKSSSSHTTFSTGLLDRLAARDRAYGLLSDLTKLGTGWNYSDAWFALARAHEEAGQVDKARDALWWCVELEEGRAVRDWRCVAAGGYVL